MATYKQIQDWVKLHYDFVPQTCWIADVKQMNNIPMRKAFNRVGECRVKPCPPEKVEPIQAALEHFGMIK